MINKIPQHIAIILDGNGRWATLRGLSRTKGHEEGARRIKDVALKANEIGVKYLTIYCFSTENWKRNLAEVNYLMTMPERLLNDEQVKKFHKENIKLNWIGRRTKVPAATANAFLKAIADTKNNTGLVLTFAFDYGSLEEITQAVMAIKNDPRITTITEEVIFNHLYTKELPPVDLLIRTGGEQRLSNFLLLQNYYAEFYFTKKYWPDFNGNALIEAIIDYNNRDRRFGGIKLDE
nr:polyprenyl diphosphate synthase [Spiroplasma eriocheiris]